jgi:ribosomal-protein-alanine N-acetyltransferase
VTAEAAARNFASLRILAKLGFKHIERFVDESEVAPKDRIIVSIVFDTPACSRTTGSPYCP